VGSSVLPLETIWEMPALVNDWERQFVGSDQTHPGLKLTIDHGTSSPVQP
jgi:hypothetical protein